MSTQLPPGQREISAFPRFGLVQFAHRFPKQLSRIELRLVGDVGHELSLLDALQGLPRVEQVSDFHCVTTWSRRSLRWGGVRFVDFFERIVVPRVRPLPNTTFLVFRGQDGAHARLLLEDLLAPDVLLADTLDGSPLTVEHGAPLRLVAPAQYGYKSVKHLSQIEFRRNDEGYRPPAFRFMDHPRARVALEERGRWVPGWLLRYLYRPLVSVTAARFAKAMEKYARERTSLLSQDDNSKP